MSQSAKVLLKNFMAPKKTHEVLNMASFVNGMCKIRDIQQVVDIGSGKGYLSYFLSKYYHLNVIGVDSSYINTAGASKRNFMMDKQWKGLLQSAIKRTNNQGSDSDPSSKKSIGKSDGTESGKDSKSTCDVVVGAARPDQEQNGDGDAERGCIPKKMMTSTSAHDQRKLCCDSMTCQQETCASHTIASGSKGQSKETGKRGKKAIGATSNSFQPITAYVNQRTDFSRFFQDEKPICLVGLHACGDLSPSMLHIFTSSEHMKILCNVSCCYHLLTEEFPEACNLEPNSKEIRDLSNGDDELVKKGEEEITCKTGNIHVGEIIDRTKVKSDDEISSRYEVKNISNETDTSKVEDNAENTINPTAFKTELESLHPGHKDEHHRESACSQEQQSSSQHLCHDEGTPCGFPMSSYLRGKEPQLNKNARMVACMAVQRVYQAKELPTEKLFYRAVFQSILVDNFENLNNNRNVGKLAGRCKDFVEYCRRAFRKLELDGSKLTDDQLLGYYNKYNPDKRNLQAFNQFRSALAPSIEGLILLDRLLYLKEQENIKMAYIVKLFNQVISPRCYAIVAVKD